MSTFFNIYLQSGDTAAINNHNMSAVHTAMCLSNHLYATRLHMFPPLLQAAFFISYGQTPAAVESFSASVVGLATFANGFSYGLHLWFARQHFSVQLAFAQKAAMPIVCVPHLRLRRWTAIVAHVPAHLVYLRLRPGGSWLGSCLRSDLYIGQFGFQMPYLFFFEDIRHLPFLDGYIKICG